ncbi:MAG: hypothetical protein PF487_04985 [Bacteroidales bacterium]|jgi:hypothetical protein|nr:hypothetical protein [Bacteroidales bacterium]
MTKLREAYPEDFEKVYPILFTGFNLKSLNKKKLERKYNSFKKLFDNHWNSPDRVIGYVLEDNEEIVGFIAYILSVREINNRSYKFCNFSTWTVNEDQRSYSILLTAPIKNLKRNNYTMVNLSPSKPAYEVFTKLLKFNKLEIKQTKVPFLPYNMISKKIKYRFDEEIDISNLTHQEIIDYESMKDYNANSLYIEKDSQSCLIVFNKIYEKRYIPFASILHISNPDLFLKCISLLRCIINLKINTFALLIDNRLINNNKIKLSMVREMPNPKLFWSESLDCSEIDNLYSENLF